MIGFTSLNLAADFVVVSWLRCCFQVSVFQNVRREVLCTWSCGASKLLEDQEEEAAAGRSSKHPAVLPSTDKQT